MRGTPASSAGRRSCPTIGVPVSAPEPVMPQNSGRREAARRDPARTTGGQGVEPPLRRNRRRAETPSSPRRRPRGKTPGHGDWPRSRWCGRACAGRSWSGARGRRGRGRRLRSRAGSVVIYVPAWKRLLVFRSALPRGERPDTIDCDASFRSFDPRSRAGSVGRGGEHHHVAEGFDPRSRAGSVERLYDMLPPQVFRSALPRGERRSPAWRRRPSRSFDPRSRAGSVWWAPRSRPPPRRFDPRSRAGSVRVGSERRAVGQVSIRAPARGASSSGGLRTKVEIGFDPRSRAGSVRRRRSSPS